ncbi:MAG: YihY/virulence factor BrkB family protein [Chloroflexi bacterium]|nr:YihY/virulence factor BrkB family protein [Chloroflexota bacterium]
MFIRLWVITKRTFLGFTSDNCTQQAAAITYYTLFSIAPLAIFTIAMLGLFFNGQEVRDKVVDWVLEIIPLSATEGRQSVSDIVEQVQNVSATVAVIGLFVTLWASLAVFASIRRALNTVWGITEHRPWAQGKLIDLLQVGVVSAVLLSSIVLTGFVRTVREVSSRHVGPLASDNNLWELPGIITPALLTFAAFGVLYKTVPAAHPRWRDVLPGAVLATVLFEVLKNSFAFYLANFNNFDLVYGSLAGLLIFLFYMFLASNILLIGGELVATLGEYHAGAFDAEINPPEPLPPVSTRVFRAMRGLFVRQ